MDTFFKFLFDFLSVFFKGILYIVNGLISGIVQMFNFSGYRDVVLFYKDDLKGSEWVFVILSIIVLILSFFSLIESIFNSNLLIRFNISSSLFGGLKSAILIYNHINKLSPNIVNNIGFQFFFI